MPDAVPQTLTYEPQPLRPGLIVYESPQGVVVRVKSRPLWQDVCRATVVALIATGLCTLLFVLMLTPSGATSEWLCLACFAFAAVVVAVDSVQRVRRRLQGDPAVDTEFLHTADHPVNPITSVQVVRGALGMDLRRPIKLRVKEHSGKWIELQADGSLEDVERTAAELRRALRLPPAPEGEWRNA